MSDRSEGRSSLRDVVVSIVEHIEKDIRGEFDCSDQQKYHNSPIMMDCETGDAIVAESFRLGKKLVAAAMDEGWGSMPPPSASVEPVIGYAPLTDEQCDAFRRAPGSFNDMLRAVHRDGFARGKANAEGEGEPQ